MFAADAKTHDDEMIFQSGVFLCSLLLHCRNLAPLQAIQAAGHFRRHGNQPGREHHGQYAYCKKILIGPHVKKTCSQTLRRQHERKFSHLGQ